MKKSICKLVNRRLLAWAMAWLAMAGIGLSLSIPAQAAQKFTPSKGMMAVQKEVGNKLDICKPVEGKDFTWCVPIHIHNLSFRATEIVTQCDANDAGGDMLAYAQVDKRIPSGQHGYDGTVKLSAKFINTMANKTPAVWDCNIAINCGSKLCPHMKAIQDKKYSGGYH